MRSLGFIERLREEIDALAGKAKIGDIKRPGMQKRSAEALIKKIRKSVRETYSKIGARSASDLRDLAVVSADLLVADSASAVGFDIFRRGLSVVDLRALADDTIVRGSVMKDWWLRQSANTQHRMALAVREGVVAGETNQEIANRLLGKRTGKTRWVEIDGKRVQVKVPDSGPVLTSSREAMAVTRTAVATLNNATNHAVMEANKDVVEAWTASAVLDGRTTPICLERDGGEWFLEDGRPTPDSTVDYEFPGHPPWHWLCRTVLVPRIFSFEEMAERATGQRGETFNKLPPATRATLDGEMPESMDSQLWLKERSPAFARKLLGPGRYDLWSRGKITTHQLLDQSGRPLTITQLQNKFD
jgi:hypothetical protein